MTKRIIIDTDPGVDDALTFLLALASPEIQLEALTITQGNVTVERGTRNALAVLEMLRLRRLWNSYTHSGMESSPSRASRSTVVESRSAWCR